MTMRQRRRQNGYRRHSFLIELGPYLYTYAKWTASQAANFRRNPWQIFRDRGTT